VNGSSANGELIRQLLAAYLSGDEQTLEQMIGPETEIYGEPGIVNAGTYHGYDGFRQWVQQWEEAWAEASYELGEVVDVSDSVLVVPVRIVARGTGSGAEVDMVFGWLFEWADGRASRFHVYASLDKALEEAQRLAEA
jgi:ketosteroid isomerase-like protein